LTPFAENVGSSSKGMASVNIFASGKLGGRPWEQLSLVEKGVADIALIVPSYHPELFADLDVVSLPNLFRTATQGSLALTRTYERGLFRRVFVGLEPLSMFATYPVVIHSHKSIKRLDDLRGLRIRVGSQMLSNVLESLGARPAKLPYGETYPALQKGVIDGVALSWRDIIEANIHHVLRYHYELPLGATPTLLVMDRRRFESLPRQLQQDLKREAGEKLAETWGKAYDQINERYKQKLANEGHTIVGPSRADEDRMQGITKATISRWIERQPHRKRIVETFRETVKGIKP
jgi:TRAP-type C4-dicarboxylate transport system substrate-binding protein